MLILDIEWLLGVCFAARSPADATPDWPPQPDRIFSALVASWGARGSRADERAALAWLECQAPPDIAAVMHEPRSSAIAYVPPNDAAASDIRIMPERRRRQPRQFPAAVLSGGAGAPHQRLTWQTAPAADLLNTLQALARDTSYIGHSSSLVRCIFFAATPETTGELKPIVTTAAPYEGRLRGLESLYARHLATADATARPHSEPLLPPKRIAPPATPRSTFGDRWIVLGYLKGDRPDLRAAAVVGRTMRNALMSAWPGEIPAWLSGHAPDGTPSREPHLAVVPLADVGFWNSATARQSWHGLALVLPQQVEAAWVGSDTPEGYANSDKLQAVLQSLGDLDRMDDAIALWLGSLGQMCLRRVTGEADKQSLRPGRYLQTSTVWSSVTPIALDRHPKGTDPRDDAATIIAESCERIGLPKPMLVQVHKHAAIAGAPSAWPAGGAPPWTGWARPGPLANRPIIHATLYFEAAVAGPVILGAGRFFGLGLCLPLDARGRS
jgi:CRISPR-associated protein Csb2